LEINFFKFCLSFPSKRSSFKSFGYYIDERGKIKKGMRADLVIWDPNGIIDLSSGNDLPSYSKMQV